MDCATHPASPPCVAGALSAYDKGKTSGRARLIGEQEIKLDASTLPRLDSTHYYECWLTDASRARMAPVGQLNSGGQGDFTVSTRSVRSLSAVEVSIQQTATTGNYSGVSVLRSSYA